MRLGRPPRPRRSRCRRTQLPRPLRTITPLAWRELPLEEMLWLATNQIPAGEVAILSGDGGGGKTTIALQLAIAVERGLGEWLGTTTQSGPVVFFSAEEPEAEMRRRLDRIARKLGIDPGELARLHFHFANRRPVCLPWRARMALCRRHQCFTRLPPPLK